MTADDAQYLTRPQAARLLQVHPRTLDRYVAARTLARYYTPGGKPRFLHADVIQLIRPDNDTPR